MRGLNLGVGYSIDRIASILYPNLKTRFFRMEWSQTPGAIAFHGLPRFPHPGLKIKKERSN
jgi:hypothetical protein